ncbi:hypothetical protein TH9_19080 [Thalassospira xiamenensis]|uniref:GNAT family N-acetyltransferase n=1 Tax=Thalassospira xiamenensis TaxID=220697 RepID=UPI000DED8F9D|nr:GNAT family N-acetyltransferase [Thalassospira xiamenensis]RCK30988.1 hypothetical protein TH9_19080 [Thalassospira xiamenensis]
MRIRKANSSDVSAIFAIRSRVRENHLSVDQLAERGITKAAFGKWIADGYGMWVADLDGAAAGFAIAIPHEATLWALFVDPDFEGRGVGRALLRVAEEWLFAQGCNDISLTTDADPKIRAHGFYESHGWHCTGDADAGQVEYIKSNPTLSLFDFG